MRVPEVLKTCVCFLCVEESHYGNRVPSYRGTGFFVSVPSESVEDRRYGYIVTAKHNVEKAKDYGDLSVRINDKDGGARCIRIVDEWIYPEDEGVDVAVLPFGGQQGLGATVLSVDMFATY